MEDLLTLFVLPEVVHGQQAFANAARRLVEAFPDRCMIWHYISARAAWDDAVPHTMDCLAGTSLVITQRFAQFGRGSHLFSQVLFLVGGAVRSDHVRRSSPRGVDAYTVSHIVRFAQKNDRLLLIVGIGMDPGVQAELKNALAAVKRDDLELVLDLDAPSLPTSLVAPLEWLASHLS